MKYLLTFLILSSSLLFIQAVQNSNGTPGNKTGSLLDKNTCAQCHLGSNVTSTVWLTSNIPTEGYTAGQTYTITLSAQDPNFNKFGFELTAENSTKKIGTFVITDAVNTQLHWRKTSVTHTIKGTAGTSNVKTWTCDWKAPIQGSGAVTFYSAVVAANNSATNAGDVVYTSSLQVPELFTQTSVNTNESNDFSIIQNNSNELLVISPYTSNKISIVNVDGKLIESKRCQNNQIINISTLPNGIYIITLVSGNKKITKEIVVNSKK